MDNLEITEIQYGPFLQYLKRDDITDVDFNGRDLWIRDVNVGRVKVTDKDVIEQLTENFIESFTAAVSNMLGENLTATNPTLEAETGNYRITVVHKSVAITGTGICIRKTLPEQRIKPGKAIQEHYCEEKVLHLLANCVKARLNMVFCGEPGVGKTECAKFLTTFIPEEEKVITVEDTLELHYHEINPGKDCMEIRVNEHYSYADAMSTVLRLTPKRVMLSETRSIEVKYLIQCWTTGISGFTTLHTDDVRKIPDRILNMLENKQDAERLENDVYVGMDVGVLLETRYDPQKEIYERYISQIGFFSRENGKNYCNLIVRNGKLENEDIVLPEDIELRMEKSGISNAFYCEELEELMKKESLEAVS